MLCFDIATREHWSSYQGVVYLSCAVNWSDNCWRGRRRRGRGRGRRRGEGEGKEEGEEGEAGEGEGKE